LACFALLALPMTLPEGLSRWHRSAILRAVGKVTVSSDGGRELEGLNAFDGDSSTVWAAVGSDRAWLALEPRAPRRVSRVRLEARRTPLPNGSPTTLLEAWQTVRVVLYRGGRKAAEQWFWLPDAATRPVQDLTLAGAVEADRIELYFYDPVSAAMDGRKVDPRFCNPGYAEIHID
jgi:hypothetical protein